MVPNVCFDGSKLFLNILYGGFKLLNLAGKVGDLLATKVIVLEPNTCENVNSTICGVTISTHRQRIGENDSIEIVVGLVTSNGTELDLTVVIEKTGWESNHKFLSGIRSDAESFVI